MPSSHPQPQPKERRQEPIPAELRNSIKEVWELIHQASHDPDVTLGYDDAIQVAAVCGGRVGGRSRSYVLTYFPSGDAERGRWFLTLHRSEIEDIADGRLTGLAMHCCTAPGCRCKFRESDGLCAYCDYVPDPEFTHLGIMAALPRLEGMGVTGLTAAATRDEVQAVLGPAQESGGGIQDRALGYIKPWVKYHRPEGQIRFEFGRQGVIEAVTFMPTGWRPGT
ncbi:MAG: hypothetical protein U0871_04505 [Gemmataceae bacterium]